MLILFSLQFDQNFTCKDSSHSDYLKLSLPVFLKCFLIFALFQPHVSHGHVSYTKKTCVLLQIQLIMKSSIV